MLCRLLFRTSSISTDGGRNAEDTVPAIHDVAFAGDEDVLALGQENFLRLSRLAGEAEELQVDRGRGGRGGGVYCLALSGFRRLGVSIGRDSLPGTQNISPHARVLGVLALSSQSNRSWMSERVEARFRWS